MSHARIKSRLGSSINQAPLVQDEIFKRCSYMAEALDFRACLHQNICRDVQPTETTMRALRPAHRWFIALRNYNQQVKVAALVRLSPCMRAKQPHLLWVKLRVKATRHLIEQLLTDSLHARSVTEFNRCCKPSRHSIEIIQSSDPSLIERKDRDNDKVVLHHAEINEGDSKKMWTQVTHGQVVNDVMAKIGSELGIRFR